MELMFSGLSCEKCLGDVRLSPFADWGESDNTWTLKEDEAKKLQKYHDKYTECLTHLRTE